MPVQTLVIDLAIRYGFQVLGALVILLAGFIAARWIGKLVDQRLQRQRMEPPMRQLIVRVIKVVVLLFALVVALDKFGFQIAPLVAGIGVAGLGVGIALQGVLGNLVAGLTIIFTKPYRVGEHISVVGVHGDVATIELFSTVLVHPDRSRVIIPNRKIVGEILHNFGTMRQASVSVALPHDVDLTSVLATVRDVTLANPRVLKDPAPYIAISEVGPAGVRIAVHPWVAVSDFAAAGSEIYQALLERLRGRGIPTALPRHEVRLLDGATVRTN
jgi:small conductance mechanosensitive channel